MIFFLRKKTSAQRRNGLENLSKAFQVMIYYQVQRLFNLPSRKKNILHSCPCTGIRRYIDPSKFMATEVTRLKISTPKWWWKVREIPFFQGNLAWWIFKIWPDIIDVADWLQFRKQPAATDGFYPLDLHTWWNSASKLHLFFKEPLVRLVIFFWRV